jgi:hypothetical protein
MTRVTDAGSPDIAGVTGAAAGAGREHGSDAAPAYAADLLAGLAVAAVAGLVLVLTARAGALALLVAVAIAQALFAASWMFAVAVPGRIGGLVIGAFAAAGADVTASVWPHGQLGALVAVLGLAVPVMFAHQLLRGAVRVRVVTSLSGIAVLVLVQVAFAALLQLRHEFPKAGEGGQLTAACVAAAAAALVAGALVDLVLPLPRFDELVPRGLLGVVVATGVAAAVSYLLVRDAAVAERFDGGRAAFVGAALGALAGLLAIGVTYVLQPPPGSVQPGADRPRARRSRLGTITRPVVAGLLPIAALAPVAFVLCMTVRH